MMNVAQSRFFHKIHRLTQKEIDLARSFIDSCNNPDVAIFAHLLLNLYINYEDNYVLNEVQKNDIEFSKVLKDIEVNTFENFVGKLEELGNKLLECKSISDLKKLDEISIYNSLYFVSLQYFRTNKMRQSVINGYGVNSDFGILANKMWNIIFIHLANLLTCNALNRNNYTFVFVKNESDMCFITGDQPVCNDLQNNGYPEKETDFEFYYPISPKSAFIIQFGQSCERYKEITVDKTWVIKHNRIIWENADKQVFSNSEDSLKEIYNRL